MGKGLGRKTGGGKQAGPIIVVSGLPRSGTSMMMKMLSEGGMPVVTDSIRTADEDNPNGYFEYEPIKQLADGRKDWLADVNQKAIKVISALLEHLPSEHHYKVIFMERDLKEILASQRKMLSHRHEESQIDDLELEERFRSHLQAVKYWLARQPNIDVLYVNYKELISNPEPQCRAIVEFLPYPLEVSRLASVPNERLYRNRAVQS